MKDYLIRATAANDEIRAFAITSREMTEYARSVHNTSPVVTAALGRSMAAASMMGTMLKNDSDVMTLQFMGSGPMKGLTVTGDITGNVKGFANNPQVVLPAKNGKLDVGGAIGVGVLRVIKDLGLKEPYVGTVPLVSGEIAEDITAYFAESEQIPTACALGVLVDTDLSVAAAGGYLIQLLPGADDAVIDKVEEGIARMGTVTQHLSRGMDVEELLRQVLSAFDLELLETVPVEYRCYCSRERMKNALRSMGKDELRALISEQGRAELTCQFCDTVQVFETEELEALAAEL